MNRNFGGSMGKWYILLFTLMGFSYLFGQGWLSGYGYRKRITISGASGAGSGYQVLLKVGEGPGASGAHFHLEGHAENFPNDANNSGDLRFTDNDEVSELKFWVEKVSGTAPNRVAYCWVKVIDDLSVTQEIYCYYGSSSASNVSSALDVGIWQFKEHQYAWAGTYPVLATWAINTNGIYQKLGDGWGRGGGRNYVFIVVPRNWLNGKYLRWRWDGNNNPSTSEVRSSIWLRIYDGIYDRKSGSDFPYNSEMALKGAGLLVDVANPSSTGSWGPETREVLANLSSATQAYVTIFLWMNSGWFSGNYSCWATTHWLEINTSSGGSGNLYFFDFNDNLFFEQYSSSTYDDYGLYKKYVSPEPSFSSAGSEEIPVYPPTVSNSGGATNVTANSATLNGSVVDNGSENPNVYIYWGTTDGGTNPSLWEHVENLGIRGVGPFSRTISGLSPNTRYYYRSYAINSAGDDWADESTSFVTAASIVVDWNNGNAQTITLLGDAEFTFVNGQPGGVYWLEVRQDAAGGRVVLWPENIRWVDGITPTLSSSSLAIDLFNFFYNGTYYLGIPYQNFR